MRTLYIHQLPDWPDWPNYRDILHLLECEALKKNPGGGRSTSYSIAMN